MPNRIPISAASEVGKKHDCRQIILLAFDGESTHIVTWGKSADDYSQAADGGNMLKKKWGWPECNDQPSRVRKLLDRVKELESVAEREIEWSVQIPPEDYLDCWSVSSYASREEAESVLGKLDDPTAFIRWRYKAIAAGPWERPK